MTAYTFNQYTWIIKQEPQDMRFTLILAATDRAIIVIQSSSKQDSRSKW